MSSSCLSSSLSSSSSTPFLVGTGLREMLQWCKLKNDGVSYFKWLKSCLCIIFWIHYSEMPVVVYPIMNYLHSATTSKVQWKKNKKSFTLRMGLVVNRSSIKKAKYIFLWKLNMLPFLKYHTLFILQEYNLFIFYWYSHVLCFELMQVISSLKRFWSNRYWDTSSMVAVSKVKTWFIGYAFLI